MSLDSGLIYDSTKMSLKTFPRLRDSPLGIVGKSPNLGIVFSPSLYISTVTELPLTKSYLKDIVDISGIGEGAVNLISNLDKMSSLSVRQSPQNILADDFIYCICKRTACRFYDQNLPQSKHLSYYEPVYRVTIQFVPNLPLTSKQRLRFEYMGLLLKGNFCFDVKGKFGTT